MKRIVSWSAVLLLIVVAMGVLGLHHATAVGAQGGTPPPFANTTESRLEMIQELKEIRNLLKEQNDLLRSGQLKVIVTELPKAGEAAKPAAAAEGGAVEVVPGSPPVGEAR